MTSLIRFITSLVLLCIVSGAIARSLQAQDVLPGDTAPAAPAATEPAQAAPTADAPALPDAEKAVEDAKKATDELVQDAKQQVDAIAKDVDKNETAQEVSAGLLQGIYKVAEQLNFSAFHWIAFALMVSGVVSYALQLILAKLVVLANMGLSFREILADSQGLVISIVGLVLTTQAAAENSQFTQSPFAVLSSAATGFLIGFIFYRWGQATEVEAVAGRRAAARVKP